MSRKIILIKQELLLLVYELNRSGLLAENEKIRPILAQLEKLLLCDLSRSEERFSRNAETDLVCRLLLEKKNLAVGTDIHDGHEGACDQGEDDVTWARPAGRKPTRPHAAGILARRH